MTIHHARRALDHLADTGFAGRFSVTNDGTLSLHCYTEEDVLTAADLSGNWTLDDIKYDKATISLSANYDGDTRVTMYLSTAEARALTDRLTAPAEASARRRPTPRR